MKQEKPFTELFKNGDQVETLSIQRIAGWFAQKNTEAPQLLLPPIQRSAVWKNEQIIDYWDSLLRGYPPGLMMLQEVSGDGLASNADNENHASQKGDYLLFDGQQRMTTVLLAFNMGYLNGKLRLWVDLGKSSTHESERLYFLRISSIGQPFGYGEKEPNSKLDLQKRKDNWSEWNNPNNEYRKNCRENLNNDLRQCKGMKDCVKDEGKCRPHYAFYHLTGKSIADGTCVVQFSDILNKLTKNGEDATVKNIIENYKINDHSTQNNVKNFVKDLNKALAQKVLLYRLNESVVEDQKNYIRFFKRLGQGGTQLSNDELVYSMLKYHFPEIRGAMQEIKKTENGKLAGEVDLALAALRVAKVLSPWETENKYEIISRPNPDNVEKIFGNDACKVSINFFKNMLAEGGNITEKKVPTLSKILSWIKNALVYDENNHNIGLPPVLLSHLPKELIDILILLTAVRINKCHEKWEGTDKIFLTRFVLYWLIFVSNYDQVSHIIFNKYVEKGGNNWLNLKEFIDPVIQEAEERGWAYHVPIPDQVKRYYLELDNFPETEDTILRAWDKRFIACDGTGSTRIGDAMRFLSTHMFTCKKILLWLQRKYLTRQFPDYDPTSERDEDLPVDLDHLIPQNLFNLKFRVSQHAGGVKKNQISRKNC
ncbi:MAG: DUF262 domain-containing protein [Bacteroidetes bacterium]|nr:DUF262 domain-containing protein [Bacteroidota bacterium]